MQYHIGKENVVQLYLTVMLASTLLVYILTEKVLPSETAPVVLCVMLVFSLLQ